MFQLTRIRSVGAALVCAALLIGCANEEPGATSANNSTLASSPKPAMQLAPPVADSLAKVTAQCPPTYPPRVTPAPGAGEIAEMPDEQLMAMLESWNPALQRAAARELADRHLAVKAALIEAAGSGNDQLRAGAASALAVMVTNELRHWQEFYPGADNSEDARKLIVEKHADLLELFIHMTKDPRREVRLSALLGLSAIGRDSMRAKRAVVELIGDPDVYLASSATYVFGKSFTPKGLSNDELFKAFGLAMNSPLPRPKGMIIKFISDMDVADQRRYIPMLLAHLDWQPMRDTMFGASGQAQAVTLLAKLNEKQLIERLPGLMTKTMRGPGLFEPCIAAIRAFGKDAQVIVPQLQAYIKEIQVDRDNARARDKAGFQKKIDTLKETVDYVQSL